MGDIGGKGSGGARRGAGRPNRSNSFLRTGEARATRLISKAIALHGETHPIVASCLRDLLHIARADPGYRGRYVSTRLRAICHILDMLVGRPREAPGSSGQNAQGALTDLMAKIEDGEFDDDP